jgi:Concanavalin A-like lectin/glucanases superfamily
VLRRLFLGCGLASTLGCNTALISLLPAGGAPSAGSPDAGSLDAGSLDAGSPDAGSLDASSMDAGSPPLPGLVSEWRLATDPSDGAGSNDGQLLGGAAFVKDPARGQVLSCNGTDAGVRVANTAGLSFTYAAWIWSNTTSHTGTNAEIDGDTLLSSNIAPQQDDFALALLSNRLAYINYNMESNGATVVTDGQWHHVAITRMDGESVALYVDGKVDGGGKAGSGDVSANASLYFCGGSFGGHYFRGLLSDVQLYDRVLAPGEVQTLFAATH